MSSNPQTDQLMGEFKPVADDWKWSAGKAFRMETPVPENKYTLTVVAPVTFEEFQKLVDNVIVPHRKWLAEIWFAELKKRGLIDMASFNAALQAVKAKAAQHGEPAS